MFHASRFFFKKNVRRVESHAGENDRKEGDGTNEKEKEDGGEKGEKHTGRFLQPVLSTSLHKKLPWID